MEFNDYIMSFKATPSKAKQCHLLNKTEGVRSEEAYDFNKSYQIALFYLQSEKRQKRVIVPKEFILLAATPHFKGFVLSAYEYFRELYRLEQKKLQLKEEAERRKMPMPSFVDAEASTLHAKAKEMSTKYAWIIFKLPKERKSQSQEKHFYETLMYFVAKVIADGFPAEFEEELTKELNRLFRNNAFNSIERRQIRKPTLLCNYPIKETVDNFITRVTTANAMNPVSRKRRDTFNEFKPKYTNSSSIIMMHYRSPLLSMIFPDKKVAMRSKSRSFK